MKPFRKHVAIAIDGGGIRGLMVARALYELEDTLGKPVGEIFNLAAGTSTGSIIAAGISAGFTARQMYTFYKDMGNTVFPKTWRSYLFPFTHNRFPLEPIQSSLEKNFGTTTVGDLWNKENQVDLVITTFDLLENRSRFIKPWKNEYAALPLAKAVRASCSVPTYFPVVDNRFVDGGVGSYSNPCYLAAYEALVCLQWDPAETTLISFGTGRNPHQFDANKTAQLWPWQWLNPVFDAFYRSSDDEQVNLVQTFFKDLDFRRFQIDLDQAIELDDTTKMD